MTKIKMRNRFAYLALTAATALVLSACGNSTEVPEVAEEPGEGGNTTSDVEALGGAEFAEAMDALYEEAVTADQTSVVIYGPGEKDKADIYKLFTERYPEISVTPVALVGPDYRAKLEAEFASGQHYADLVQTGDTAIAEGLENGYLTQYTPATAEDLDDESFAEREGYAYAPSASAFGILYNTDLISEDEAPAGWEDLLDPSLKGKMTSDDVTRFGAGFGTLSHLLWDGRLDENFIEGLAEQEITFQASTPVAGSAVATGQFAVSPLYPLSYYMNDKKKNAPVEIVFPTEGGVHLSPHYVSILEGAPNPEAAKLLMSWLFTPEAQQAVADRGYYPLIPGELGPEGRSAANELDQLKPIDLDTVQQVMGSNLEIVTTKFGN